MHLKLFKLSLEESLVKQILLLFLIGVVNVLYSQDTINSRVFTPNVSEIIGLQLTGNTDNKVTIANLNETKINEAPGSIIVITAEDIEKNAYRDLQDILINIPGFNIATDVQNGTGITLRGSWANEAKILIMIDGMVMNDMAYGSFVLGGRVPLLNIQRIEIIKGASSSIYGGIAGLGVINIITKSGKTSKGSSFLLDAGISSKYLSHTRFTFANTTYLLNDFEVSVCGSVFNGNKSNQLITHPDSMQTNFRDSSLTNNVFVEMRLKRNNFEYRILYDDYNFQSTFERITSLARNLINEISYSRKINNLNINGLLSYSDQIPWNTQYGDPTIYDVQNLKTNKFKASIISNLELTKHVNFLLGSKFQTDYMKFYRSGLLLNDGNQSNRFNSIAVFGEATFRTKFINTYLGGRYDYYVPFKPNIAPRISFTKEFKNFSYKLIYGESFKIPTLQNINLAYANSSPLLPEKMKDTQAELGLKIANQNININAFHTEVQDIIVYGYDIGNKVESYVNEGNITFAGYEVMMNNKVKFLELKTIYSNYNVLSATSYNYLVDTFDLKMGTLAIPKHKFCANVRVELSKKNSIVLNYIYQSSKYSIEQINSYNQEYGRIKYNPTHLVDLSFHTKTIFKYFDIAIGLKNILNTNNYYNFPNASGYPTAIGMGRELYTQIKLNL